MYNIVTNDNYVERKSWIVANYIFIYLLLEASASVNYCHCDTPPPPTSGLNKNKQKKEKEFSVRRLFHLTVLMGRTMICNPTTLDWGDCQSRVASTITKGS